MAVLFGDIVRDARAEVYRAYPNDSTWGAYQCYGQPDFRLQSMIETARHPVEPLIFASPNEARAAILRIAALGEVGGERDTATDLAELQRIEEAVANLGWLAHADIRATLASAYAELGQFEVAIDHYSAAALAEYASVPVRAIEQRLNLLTRQAATRAADNVGEKRSKRNEAKKTIETSIVQLKGLIEVSGETLERLSLIGGSYKRLAQITSGSERIGNLTEMMNFYRAARKLGQERGVDNIFYPWSQELAAGVIVRLRSKDAKSPDFAGLRKLPPANDCSEFWQQILPADLVLLERVVDGAVSEGDQREILEAYLRVWRHTGSRRELSSLLTHVSFLIDMLADQTAVKRKPRPLLDQLQNLRRLIEQSTQE